MQTGFTGYTWHLAKDATAAVSLCALCGDFGFSLFAPCGAVSMSALAFCVDGVLCFYVPCVRARVCVIVSALVCVRVRAI